MCRSFVQAHRGLGYELIEDRFDDEGYTGATLDRPALQRLLGLLRSGGLDRLVIYRLDRLSRDLRHFVNLGQELREHKVGLTVVAAPELGVAALDNLMLNVLASFAEFEREILRERTRAGLAHARENGKRLGRPATAVVHAAEIRKLHRAGVSKSEIARRVQIGRTSVRRILGAKS